MFAAALLILGLCSSAFAAGSYNYIRGDALGPANWATDSNSCGGTSNSPIDFDTVKEKSKVAWTWSNWDAASEWTVENMGKTIQFTLTSADDITTTGGGLSPTYKVAQFHFHWGQNNDKGSEHTVGGMSYPLEVHVVHYRSDFADLGTAFASGQSNALAVVGVFFESQAADNADLADLFAGVDQVQNYTDSVSNVSLTSLNQIVSAASASDWYRYNGGLTTPGCEEIVAWTVFKKPVPIGADQLAKFRSAKTGSYGTELYRPVQAQNDRDVYRYTDKVNGALPLTVSLLTLLTTSSFLLL